ncbi:MAG: family 1 extracellular solute-binding protein [Paenibacillaceae bacterium]|nr:family 1 extracellular solute-binding protein [Paenibacillaceae bacterium]
MEIDYKNRGCEQLGLPYEVNFNALYYNKDIFDKFGVAYPPDGLTWDAVAELAKKLSRQDGSIQYKGLNFHGLYRLAFPLSLSYVDGMTDKSDMTNSAGWKRAFELGKKINSIPGNAMGKNPYNSFLKDKDTAMFATVNLFPYLGDAANSGLNWDLAQYPSYSDHPNTYSYIDEQVLMITKSSKHKDEAMEVLKVLTSDEVQTLFVKAGRASPLTNPSMRQMFGTGAPFLQGKHLAGIFKSSSAPAPIPSIYHAKAKSLSDVIFEDYLADKIDLNTALRQADEQINSYVASQKTK